MLMKKIALNITVFVIFYIIAAGAAARTAPEVIRKTFDVKPRGQLTLNSRLGAIDVKTANRNEVSLVFAKSMESGSGVRVGGLSSSEVETLIQEAFSDFDVTFEHSDSDVLIVGEFKRGWEYWMKRSRQMPFLLSQLKIRFQVTVPTQYNVDLKTAFSGDIDVDDIGGEALAETYGGNITFGVVNGTVWGKTAGGGNIALESCHSKVDVETYGGDIVLGNIEGSLKAKNAGSGNIQTGRVGGAVEAETYGGNLRFGIVKGTVWAKTAGGGDITLEGCHGKVDVETYGGEVVLGDIEGSLKAKNAGSGNIQAGNIGGDVEGETYGGDLRFGVVKGTAWAKTAGGGDITFEGCRSNVVGVKTYGGDIVLGNIAGYVKAENAGSGDIQIGNVGGTIEAKTYGGDLDFGTVKGAVRGRTAGGGNITLKGSQGRVDLNTYGGYIHAEITQQPQYQWTLETSGGGEIIATLFSRISVNLDARASSGSVSSDFTVHGSKSKNSLRGTINGGGTLLKLRASSGDIHLKRK